MFAAEEANVTRTRFRVVLIKLNFGYFGEPLPGETGSE